MWHAGYPLVLIFIATDVLESKAVTMQIQRFISGDPLQCYVWKDSTEEKDVCYH